MDFVLPLLPLSKKCTTLDQCDILPPLVFNNKDNFNTIKNRKF